MKQHGCVCMVIYRNPLVALGTPFLSSFAQMGLEKLVLLHVGHMIIPSLVPRPSSSFSALVGEPGNKVTNDGISQSGQAVVGQEP